MTNDMTTRTDTAPAAQKPQIAKGGALAALVPATLDDAFRLAKALSSAGDMVPKHFQGKPEATMAAIVRGMEVGLAPMQALSQIAVINGRASIWGDAIPALLQRAGHHIDVEIEGEGEKLVAVATLTRGDTGKKVVRRFGMADAKRAGLTGKQGPWQQYPARMCSHRARTWAARDGAADALMGMQIAEEMQDVGPDHARDVTERKPRRGSTTFIPASAPAPEPAVDEIHDAEEVEENIDPETGEVLDGPTPEQLAEAERVAREWADEQAKRDREAEA